MVDAKWTTRLSKWALRLGVFALVLTIGGALLARVDLIPKLTGLNFMLGGALSAILGTVLGLIGVGMNMRNKAGLMRTALIGLLLSGGLAGFMVSRAMIASKVPPIHDLTTDLVNPPSFGRLKLGADNLRGVETVEKWKELHAKAYADLKPIIVAKAPATVIANAERLARERGWVVANTDSGAGTMEATASVSLIKFQDDVVVRVAPTGDGRGSRVDMRSVSRVGISDLGVNAKRIREFLAALSRV
jgi:uncharacterized protein (DUF1499 family)